MTTSTGITLGDALAYRQPAGTGLTGWHEPGQAEPGEPDAADVNDGEGEWAA